MKLSGKTAIVTGAAQGIGKGVALEFAKEGADIAILDLNGEKLAETAKEIEALGRRCYQAVGNVADEETVKTFVENVTKEFGRIDALTHCAGILRSCAIIDQDVKDWDTVIADNQLIEIAKAISINASVIIMDEPSSAIGDEEIEILFQQIAALKANNVAILYITHKMDEIFRIADEITIIRDGQWVESGPASDYMPDKLVARMVGREITSVFPKDTTVPIGDIIFEVKDFTQEKADGGRFRNINFQLHAGEILGFAGLVGAGRTEVMRAVFGLDKKTTGQVFLNGQELRIRNTADAIKNGIAMVNEDRRQYGLVLGRSIHHNVSLANMKKYTRTGLVNDKNDQHGRGEGTADSPD